MDFERYFFIVFMWQMYLIYLRKALILVSGLGIFLRVLGGAIFMRSLIAVFWQNHYNVGFLWERGGLEHQAGPFSPAVFRLSPLSRAEPRETNTLFSEQPLPSAALV